MGSGGTPLPTVEAGPGLRVWFKLDPSLTTGLMGERWVSPATFTAIDDRSEAIVEVRAQLVDERHHASDVIAAWAAADAAILGVSGRQGHRMELRVRRAGRTSLRVEHASGLAVLVVRAVHDGKAWRIDVTQ